MNNRTRTPAEAGGRAAGRCQKGRGFTLVELIMVLVLVGIMIGIAVPRIDFRRARVDSAALQLSSRLLVSQRQAVVQQHDVRVSFHVDERYYEVHQDADNDGAIDGGEGVVRFQLEDGTTFGRGGAPALDGASTSPDVTFPESPISGHPHVAFHRNGSASSEGVVYLTAFPPAGGAPDRAIRLRRATGQTECWTYREGSWKEPC